MYLFNFQGNDLYSSRNGVTQSRNNTQWEAAAHMNKLPHNLLHEMLGNESSLDDMCHPRNDLGTWFGAFGLWNFSNVVPGTLEITEGWTRPTRTHQVGN